MVQSYQISLKGTGYKRSLHLKNWIFKVLFPKSHLTIRLPGTSYWPLTSSGWFQLPHASETVFPPSSPSPHLSFSYSQVPVVSHAEQFGHLCIYLICLISKLHLPHWSHWWGYSKNRVVYSLRTVMSAITNSSSWYPHVHTCTHTHIFHKIQVVLYKLLGSSFFHQYFPWKTFFSVITCFSTAWF